MEEKIPNRLLRPETTTRNRTMIDLVVEADRLRRLGRRRNRLGQGLDPYRRRRPTRQQSRARPHGRRPRHRRSRHTERLQRRLRRRRNDEGMIKTVAGIVTITIVVIVVSDEGVIERGARSSRWSPVRRRVDEIDDIIGTIGVVTIVVVVGMRGDIAARVVIDIVIEIIVIERRIRVIDTVRVILDPKGMLKMRSLFQLISQN